ncbi:MAG: hypothetical protein D8B47_07220 [Kingella sp. (in: b-proteobacteria)]|nr:MAG: hypothetical protein D8B47_07220 [Kingella sp. (in: b-proteobacteria)]
MKSSLKAKSSLKKRAAWQSRQFRPSYPAGILTLRQRVPTIPHRPSRTEFLQAAGAFPHAAPAA